MKTRFSGWLVGAALVLLTCSQMNTARADTIDYIFSGIASGNVNGTAFSNASFTIDLTGDTNTVFNPPFFSSIFENLGAATISLAGFGSGVFTTPHGVFDNQGVPVAGFSHVNAGQISADELDISNSAFATYDLTTAIGPLSVSLATLSLSNDPTTIGTVTFSTASNLSFQATTAAAVPEPATYVTMFLCLGSIIVMRHRKKATAKPESLSS